MTRSKNSGGYANQSGSTLEHMIMRVLQDKGFEVLSYAQYKNGPDLFRSGELLVRNAPYTTIYGHPGKTEFLLISALHHLEIRIECKWQQSGGSVDEKFPYVYLNALEAMPEPQIFIVYGGEGAKAGAVAWLRQAVKEGRYRPSSSNKTVQVFSVEQFMAWANKTFRD